MSKTITLSGNNIIFTKLYTNDFENEIYVCDICGLPQHQLLESEPFDNGNASDTIVRLCEPCVRNLSNLFIALKKQKEEK